MHIQQHVTSGAYEGVAERIRLAKARTRQERSAGLADLNELFRSGTVPNPPLDGRYAGELVALAISPVFVWRPGPVASRTLAWKGKRFDATRARGDNIFRLDSLLRIRRWSPGYRGYVDDGPDTFRAFPFRTYTGPAKNDPKRQVLKIDYDLPDNPRLTIRRVLDELVQVADGLYLGKAYFHWWWGKWQLVAFFSLTESTPR